MEQTQSYTYHGSNQALSRIEDDRRKQDGQLLCTTVSANVARRYGEVVTRCTINEVPTKVLSLDDWRSGFVSFSDLQKEGYAAVRVTGESDDFDYPVDMVVALDGTALTVHSVVTAAELKAVQSGLPQAHQPQGPSSVGWDQMVVTDYGNVDKALKAHGWTIFEDGVCRSRVPADDYWREYLVCAMPLTKGWRVEDNYGHGEGYTDTREAALRLADWWRRHEQSRRRDYLKDLDKPHPEFSPAEDLMPF